MFKNIRLYQIAFFLFFILSNADAIAEEAKKTGDYYIRKITITSGDIFDDQGALYETANSLKINTKEEVIKRELLFKEGQKYNHFLIDESERNLRQLAFLRDVHIQPTFSGEFVDIEVIANDTWTVFPYVSITTGSGANKETYGISESNLLGLGKRVEALYSLDEGRQKVEGVYDDRRLLGGYEQLTMGVFERSDGYRAIGLYGHPFRSLIEESAWSLDTDFSDLVERRFENGDENFIYRKKQEAISSGYTFANTESLSIVKRLTLGYDYSNTNFAEANQQDYKDVNIDPQSVSNDPLLLARDRRYSGPFVGLQIIEPDFISMSYLDRFSREEDYNLGNEFLARATFAGNAFGSIEDALLFKISDSDGMELGKDSFLRGKLGGFSRLNDDGLENSLISGDLKYYNYFGPKYLAGTYLGRHTFVTSLSFDFGDRLDKDRQLILGAGTGMRGYDERAFTGEQSLVLNIEERSFLVDDLYQLVSVGTAVFCDVGGTSDYGLGDIVKRNIKADVGVGLRFGFLRSSGGSIIRVDLAFPTNDADDGTKAWEPRLLISAGQLVNARLPEESQQAPGSNVALKFLP